MHFSAALFQSPLQNTSTFWWVFAILRPELNCFVTRILADPTEVTRTALQNAASISAMFLTTEVAIAELPDEHSHDEAPMSPGMGGMMGM